MTRNRPAPRSGRSVRPAALVALLAALHSAGLGAGPVRDYRAFDGVATSKRGGVKLIVLRTFSLGGKPRVLALDPATLRTAVLAADRFVLEAAPREAALRQFGPTAYSGALRDALANSGKTQNAGLTNLPASPPGVSLTVDLCPSRKPLDRRLFEALVREFGREEKPVPVAVAVTGIWMEQHEADLAYIKKLEKAGHIRVTWINHSYHHRWDRSLPLEHNFLLEKGTDVAAEVLRTEAAMIERGLTPSIFFRFPGLVSDRELALVVESFGLVPVGTDAWLAKNQWPKEGSIVLVHANGNEPIGVSRFLELVRRERESILGGRWLLLDLRDAVVRQEKAGDQK